MCAAAGAYFLFQLVIEIFITNYYAYYYAFSLYSMLFALLIIRQGSHMLPVSLLILSSLVLYVSQLVFTGESFFYDWYEMNYVILNGLFVASLTVLPDKYQIFFDVENDKDRDSFISFFVPILLKNVKNLIFRRSLR